MLFRVNHLRTSRRRQREGGYLLLAIMLMMAFMVITLTYVVAPRIVQQMKRDREEEMIHRGTEYARAIKKFYKKNGRYPTTLDDLDKGQIRFLRKRYKDPLSKEGQWKLLRYGDIATLLNTAGPGTPVGALGQNGGIVTPGGGIQAGNLPLNLQRFGTQQTPGAIGGIAASSYQGSYPGTVSGFQADSYQGSNPGTVTGFQNGSDQGSNPTGSQSASSNQQSSSPFGQSSTNDNQSFGGGAIVGVGSLSKDPTIRIYNKKKTYNEWQFIYNPIMDQQQGLLRGPYQPTTIGNTNIGTPAGQLNGQQQNNSPFGQSNSPFGQQQPSGGPGQQPGISQPGSKYPPDQNQQ